MSPPKPTPTTPARQAREPQRRPGKLRVAALLAAGAQLIAERGFESATMAEIAARAEAPIGSLYRFFPNKDILADALIRRYSQFIEDAFEKIASDAGSSTEAFATALLTSIVELRGETQAVLALLDARANGSVRRREFHDNILRNIARLLTRRDPRLGSKVDDMAVVLLQNIKAMKSLSLEHDAGAIGELRTMTRLYLESQLGK